jgi:hypothetical protein
MKNDGRLRPTDPLYQEAMALEMTIRVIRRARGKKNPIDLPAGTPEYDAATYEFLRDVYQALGGDPDELQRLDA